MQKIATVIGTTGVGKSQLGVELCKALGGQIINADAMQVYRGLDIITNKMPFHERQGVQHHLMDFLDCEEEYKVTEFKKDATQCIEKLIHEKQLPVVVGGTNYYVQSLLYQNSLIKDEPQGDQYIRSPSPEPMPELDALQTSELYSRLQEIDPIMANKWHPSNRRKIIRSLQVFYQLGRKQSDIIKEQKDHLQIHGSQSRFKSVIFWLYADPQKLNPRLDERVNTMIDSGLFDEIKQLRHQVVQGQVNIPGQDLEKYQRGLWQAIGYKEFDPYFTAVESNSLDHEKLSQLRMECTERMKAATRRYAKRQVQWIRNKLLPTVWNAQQQNDVMVYLLDASDLTEWDTNVRQKAIEVAKAFQADEKMPNPQDFGEIAKTMLTETNTQDTQSRILSWTNHICPVCKSEKGDQVILYGDIEWEQHRKSRWHKKSIKHQKLQAKRQVNLD
ncbi:IPP transferase-domain-containing protein [Absidia repens]|uniref:tRNA dimethylallyltransferase n=1 Tax=Absidia repens TaxID=90262 RepID=A0A1X2J297_9FUNG|nr:IPP transferase-domain-containing protein [Absidia repens]